MRSIFNRISFELYRSLPFLSLKIVGILVLFSFLFYFPVIYSQSFYTDDLYRILGGEYGWILLGRFLAYGISLVYSTNLAITVDAAPLTWVLSILIYGLSACCVFMKISSVKKEFALPLSIVFIANPFFIENLIYRFDSLGMALALFFSTLSFSMRWNLTSCFLKVVFLIVCLNFYQPFVNLFLGLVGIELALLFSLQHQSYKIFSIVYRSLIVFVIANILYFIQFKSIIYLLSYLKSFTPTVRDSFLPFDSLLILKILQNFAGAFDIFFEFWSDYAFYILVITPFLLLSITKILKKKDFYTVLGLIFAVMFIFVSGIGPMAILEKQFLSPRALSYFPSVLMFFSLVLMINKKKYAWIMALPIFACLIFSYRVGNIHKLQREYETPIMMNLTKDLARLKKVETIDSVGAVRLAPFARNIIETTPFGGFLKRDAWITVGYIRMFGETRLAFHWMSAHQRMEKEFWSIYPSIQPPALETDPFYKIYTQGSRAWIVWQE